MCYSDIIIHFLFVVVSRFLLSAKTHSFFKFFLFNIFVICSFFLLWIPERMTAWQTIVNLPLDILTGYIKEQSDSPGLKEWIRIYTLAFSLLFNGVVLLVANWKRSFCARSHSWAQLCEEICGHSGAFANIWNVRDTRESCPSHKCVYFAFDVK